jgi:preprotein translocase subunit YajC
MIGASGGGSSFFLLLIIAFGVLWFVLIRPQKRRQVEQQQMLNQLNVGDEVVTAGGIYGEITAVDDDDVMVRIAPQLEVKVARRAIGGVVRPEPEEEAEPQTGSQPEVEEVPKEAAPAEPEAPSQE